MRSWESDELRPAVREQFWEHVLDFETAPLTTNFEQLIDAGVGLPAPETLNDEQIRETLGKVIAALADLRVFISETNHLSDRELYAHLWSRSLREEVPLLDDDTGTWHVNILDGCSEEDIHLYLKHYADEQWRQHWHDDFPEYEMPPHEDPPYDRDRHLPKPDEDAPVG